MTRRLVGLACVLVACADGGGVAPVADGGGGGGAPGDLPDAAAPRDLGTDLGGEEDAGLPMDAGASDPPELTLRWASDEAQPLVGWLEVAATEPVQVAVTAEGPGGPHRRRSRDLETTQRLPITGLVEGAAYALSVAARTADGREARASLEVEVGVVPPEFRPDVALMEGPSDHAGLVLTGQVRGGIISYFAFDGAGRLVWHYVDPEARGFAPPLIRPLEGGIYAIALADEIRGVDVTGATRFSLPSPEGERFHHDFEILPNGHLLALSEEVRRIEGPAGDLVDIIGDVVLELSPEGRTVHRWAALDHLDGSRFPDELAYRTLTRDGIEAFDWSHGNAAHYRVSDASVVLSLRNQHWVMVIDWPAGSVRWRLGDDGDLALVDDDPAYDARWPYAQHAPTWAADGRLLVYDNGDPARKDAGFADVTRVVEFALDLETRTATQTWSWAAPFYTPVVGDVDELSPGALYLVTCGVTDELGAGAIYEVDREGTVQWSARVGGGAIYRSEWVPELPSAD
ncbi:MAG: aryl-sulfate sulfotransferase [Myxococcota bacterium]